MTPELILLLAAAMVALQIVPILLRRELRDELPYVLLLAGDLALLGFAHATHRHVSMVAFVAEALAAVLALLPRALDVIERRAIAQESFGAAIKVGRFRELVVPGRGSLKRRRHLEDLRDVREGRVREVIERLRAEVARTEDAPRAAQLHEQLVTMLLVDQRFADGVAHFERHLGFEYVAPRPRLAAYLLRAYAESGDLKRAAQLMALLEDGPAARDPMAGGLVLEARLIFLAFLGAQAQLDSAFGADGPAHELPAPAQKFLRDTARARADANAALDPSIRALADALFARLMAQKASRPSRKRAPVTLALIAANLAAFAVAILPIDDEASLIRAGALFRPAVLGGEWWRAATGMFLHANFLHLGINMYGLYLLGRFSEDIFGGTRFFLVYVAGGVAGAAGSTLVGAGPLSVGASGAIMGLLGALIVTLVLRRGTWPEAWRRTLLVNLLLLGGLQIYIGFQVAMIDNAAHVGGMLGGAAAALVLAPGGIVGEGRTARSVLRALFVLVALALASGAVQVARTPLPRTLARLAMRPVELGGVRLSLPSYWELDVEHGKAEDPFLDLKLSVSLADGAPRIEAVPPDEPRFQSLVDRIRRSAVRAAP